MNPLNLFQENVLPKAISQINLNDSNLKPKEIPKHNGDGKYLYRWCILTEIIM